MWTIGPFYIQCRLAWVLHHAGRIYQASVGKQMAYAGPTHCDSPSVPLTVPSCSRSMQPSSVSVVVLLSFSRPRQGDIGHEPVPRHPFNSQPFACSSEASLSVSATCRLGLGRRQLNVARRAEDDRVRVGFLHVPGHGGAFNDALQARNVLVSLHGD